MMKSAPSVATISANRPFLLEIARAVLAESGSDAEYLTKTLILLPNRRACRSLREAFLEVSNGKPLLLPRILPIGELEEESTLLGDIAGSLSEIEALAPVIAEKRRQFLLTQLVMEFEKARGSRDHRVDQAVELARQLARFIDDVAREGLSFASLEGLVPEELATHWQQTLAFLSIVSHSWPQILEKQGVIDPVTQRNAVLAAVVKGWQQRPPQTRVIAAGSTGSQPATASLLAAISCLPQGIVILPSLDHAMPRQEWDLLEQTHPQYALKQLLERIGIEREQVEAFGGTTDSPRLSILRAALAPPAATTHWPALTLPLAEGCAGLQLATADTALDEARIIAIALREQLETPAATAALVTPDRQLARMVVAQMQRFGVTIDDSAGRLLSDTPPASFLRLSIDMLASKAAPAELLALLRHPLAAAGRPTAQCRELSRKLELSLLRGVRFAPGFDALHAASLTLETRIPALEELLAELAKASQELCELLQQKRVRLADMISAHMRFAEYLATTDDIAGTERLWAGEAGGALAAHLADILAHSDVMDDIDPNLYPGLLGALMAGASYWPRFGLHPRLHILSPMEARLQRFDLVILGGLNEGTWPALPSIDPWMSRPMRTQFGMPPSERAIGQSAHDIWQLCAAPHVLLTRARKKDGAPTVPSRWLVRLETLIGGHAPQLLQELRQDVRYASLLRTLDAPTPLPAAKRPEPTPPLSARPRRMRVTAIDTWLTDPYMIYARNILGLRALEPLDKEPDAADFGNLVHEALENFARENPHYMPHDALAELLNYGREAFAKMMDRPAVECLWWPRFEAMAAWLIGQEQKRRGTITSIIAEREGMLELDVDGKTFTLTTRIDRLEISGSGTATIVDYKTGAMPTEGEMKKGEANQLPLTALVAEQGELHPSAGKLHVAALEYWKLAGNSDNCEIVSVAAPELIAAAKERLIALIREYDRQETAYTAQDVSSRYNDYEHLTRRQEWEAV